MGRRLGATGLQKTLYLEIKHGFEGLVYEVLGQRFQLDGFARVGADPDNQHELALWSSKCPDCGFDFTYRTQMRTPMKVRLCEPCMEFAAKLRNKDTQRRLATRR